MKTSVNHHPNKFSLHSKRLFDIIVSAILILILLPLMFVLVVLIRRDGGSALFAHTRVGRNGRQFRCLKFRTMVINAENILAVILQNDTLAAELWATTRKLQSDPRITRVGAFLRFTSLDELPQLFNVLIGDMSLVGPRPVIQAELIENYGPNAGIYLQVRPGMTGLWQVSGRSSTTYSQRVALDIRYVLEFSIWQDLKILVRTVPAVLARRGAC